MILIRWKKQTKKKHKSPHRKFIYFLIGRIFFFLFDFFFFRREYRLRYVFMGSSMSDGQLDMRFSLRAVSFDKQFLKVKKKLLYVWL